MNNITRLRVSPKIYDYSYHWCNKALHTFKGLDFLYDKDIKILDIGCGDKIYSHFFKKAKYIGVDIDGSNKNIDVCASIEELPFLNSEFDLIICSEVLEHVEDLTAAISEIKRVLKKNGYLYLSTPNSFPYHGVPFDYQRLTRFFFEKKFNDFLTVSIQESNSIFSAPFLTFNIILYKTMPKELLAPIFFFVNILVYVIELTLKAILYFINDQKKKYFYFFYGLPVDISLILKKNEK